jgi:hypothetical protein
MVAYTLLPLQATAITTDKQQYNMCHYYEHYQHYINKLYVGDTHIAWLVCQIQLVLRILAV